MKKSKLPTYVRGDRVRVSFAATSQVLLGTVRHVNGVEVFGDLDHGGTFFRRADTDRIAPESEA